MQCQRDAPVAQVAKAAAESAPIPAPATAVPERSGQRFEPDGANGLPLAHGLADSLTGLLASVVARRRSDGCASAALARKTAIRDDPSDTSRGIHSEFVGTLRERINPDIHYGPLRNDSGTWMTAVLYPTLDFEGTAPKTGTWPWWWGAGGGSDNPDYWVRGHLLNDNLGGPGEPRNLTPITKKCNSRHHSLVESLCKYAFERGQLVTYTVTPRYDGVGPPLEAIAKNPHRTFWSYLATHLDCEWLFQNRNGTTVGEGNTAIPNTH